MDIESFLALAKARTSCRSYKMDAVPDPMIENCLEAARLAPSACDKQPWRFAVVKDPAKRAEICRSGLLPALPMPWLADAPVIIAVCAETNFITHKLAPAVSGVPYHLLDLGIAGEHLVLAAQSQGLGTCWIGWFKAKKVKKILSLPKTWRPVSLISLGFPDRTGEPRPRKKLDEIMLTIPQTGL